MSKVMEKYNLYKGKLEKYLHESNMVAEIFGKIEERTKVKRINIALGMIGFLAVYLAIGYGAPFLCNFIGFLFPAYASIKAIESKEKDDDTRWLIYWVAYSTFALTEFFADIFLFWVPFYWLLKCIILLWLMAPGDMSGSLTVYYRIVRPYVLKHQDQIDKNMDAFKEGATEFAGEAKRAATEAGADKVMEDLVKLD